MDESYFNMVMSMETKLFLSNYYFYQIYIYILWGPRLTSRESPCSVIPEINAHRTQIPNKRVLHPYIPFDTINDHFGRVLHT